MKLFLSVASASAVSAFQCYECSTHTINDFNPCKTIHENENPQTCESEIGCFGTDVIAFSENYPNGSLEIITRGCGKASQGCVCYNAGDPLPGGNEGEVIENDSSICSMHCEEDLCNTMVPSTTTTSTTTTSDGSGSTTVPSTTTSTSTTTTTSNTSTTTTTSNTSTTTTTADATTTILSSTLLAIFALLW